MRTPTNRSALRAADAADPVTAVVRAWTNPGVYPAWHYRAVRVVRRAMPLLAHALDRLATNPPEGDRPMSTEPRIVIMCRTCGTTASWPDKDFERARADSWETSHQGHDYTRYVR